MAASKKRTSRFCEFPPLLAVVMERMGYSLILEALRAGYKTLPQASLSHRIRLWREAPRSFGGINVSNCVFDMMAIWA